MKITVILLQPYGFYLLYLFNLQYLNNYYFVLHCHQTIRAIWISVMISVKCIIVKYKLLNIIVT